MHMVDNREMRVCVLCYVMCVCCSVMCMVFCGVSMVFRDVLNMMFYNCIIRYMYTGISLVKLCFVYVYVCM